ncbi:unnamed protein product, partial [Staurois parvus]
MVLIHEFSECHFCHFQISHHSIPIRPDIAGDGTQKTDAGIRQRTLQGTLQEGH